MGLRRRLSDVAASRSGAAKMAVPLQLASTTWRGLAIGGPMPRLLMPPFHRKAHRAALERSARAKKDDRSELSGLLRQTTSKLDMPAALSILSVCTALSGRYRRGRSRDGRCSARPPSPAAESCPDGLKGVARCNSRQIGAVGRAPSVPPQQRPNAR